MSNNPAVPIPTAGTVCNVSSGNSNAFLQPQASVTGNQQKQPSIIQHQSAADKEAAAIKELQAIVNRRSAIPSLLELNSKNCQGSNRRGRSVRSTRSTASSDRLDMSDRSGVSIRSGKSARSRKSGKTGMSVSWSMCSRKDSLPEYNKKKVAPPGDRGSESDADVNVNASTVTLFNPNMSAMQIFHDNYRYVEVVNATSLHMEITSTADVMETCNNMLSHFAKVCAREMASFMADFYASLGLQLTPVTDFRFSKVQTELVNIHCRVDRLPKESPLRLHMVANRADRGWIVQVNEAYGWTCIDTYMSLRDEPRNICSIGQVEALLLRHIEMNLKFRAKFYGMSKEKPYYQQLKPYVMRVGRRGYKASGPNNSPSHAAWGIGEHILGSINRMSSVIYFTLHELADVEKRQRIPLQRKILFNKVRTVFLQKLEPRIELSRTVLTVLSRLSDDYTFILFGLKDSTIYGKYVTDIHRLQHMTEILVLHIAKIVMMRRVQENFLVTEDKLEAISTYSKEIGPLCVPMMLALEMYPTIDTLTDKEEEDTLDFALKCFDKYCLPSEDEDCGVDDGDGAANDLGPPEAKVARTETTTPPTM